MKTNKMFGFAAGLAAVALVGLLGCAQATSGSGSASSASYAGEADYYFPVHQVGILANAHVKTDANGNVISADIKEWMDPSSWVYSTGTKGALVGGEVIRFPFAGHNSTFAAIANYAYFYFDPVSKGWVEWVPSASKPVFPSASTVITLTNTPATSLATAVANFDLKMSGVAYSKAYAAAAAAAADHISAVDDSYLTTVTFSGATSKVTDADFAVTVSSYNAAFQIKARAQAVAAIASASATGAGALCKSDTSAVYFPMNSASGHSTGYLGYRANLTALKAFFGNNPTADYASAVQGTHSLPAVTSDYKTLVTDSGDLAARDVANAWTVKINGVDTVTGATYSDFPNYALGLQNAYLFAIGEGKAGDIRSVK